MNRLRFSLFTLITCLLALQGRAQERERPGLEQEIWTSIGMKGKPMFLKDLIGKKTAKRLRTSAELGYRSADAFFAGKQTYLELAAAYKLNNHFSIGSEGRYAYRSEGMNRQRAAVLLGYETKFDRFEVGYQFDYQHNFRPIGEQREVLRNKFSINYNIRKFKLDPKFSVEFFQWAGYKGLIYFGTRYKLATEWSPWKGHAFDLGIVHDRERAIFAPVYRVIVAVGYTLEL